MSEIAANIAKVRARLQQARPQQAQQLKGLPENPVRLLGVSKRQSAAAIRQAYHAGLKDFGENYLQEALKKMDELADLPLHWHFIGSLQRNKTKEVAERFDWIHSLDRLKIAQRLSDQRPSSLPPLRVCIQVNIDGERSKAGLAPDEVCSLAQDISNLPGLQLRGLMAIPSPEFGRDGLESAFARMGELFKKLQKQLPDQQIDSLSMGMSADLELAIAAGSTMVRIGTDIFGERKI